MINVGMIGTNNVSQQFADAVKESPYFHLTSIYDDSLNEATKFAQLNGSVAYFDDIDEFFNVGDFDTVYVASPNSVHFNQVSKAITHGKNVIGEKTAFANSTEMDKILDLLEENPEVMYFEGMRHIHTPNFHVMEEQFDNMEEITGANLIYSKYSSTYDAVRAGETPSLFDLNLGGGALQDLGVYPVYDALVLFGMPETVSYFPQIIRTGVDGKGTGILRYKDFDVTINVSKITNSFATSEIYGLRDVIEIDSAGEFTKVGYVDSQKNRVDLSNPNALTNPLAPEVEDFGKILSNKNSDESQRLYNYWLNLCVQANDVLYKLRKSSNLLYSFEKEAL